jgi:uncharacterized repeat protein (TIGR03806 family)
MFAGLVLGLAVSANLVLHLSPAATDPWRGPYPDDPELPPGFADTVIATGITGATGLAVAPDGRLFVCEQTGTLRVIKNDVLLPRPFVTVSVDSYWERGLIGVCLDPDFPRRPYVYLCYVTPKPYPHHRISRFTAQGDVAVPGSEMILLEGDDQTKLGGAQPAGHQGGAIQFGKDGKLYIAIGEQTAGEPAQRLDTFQGKLLRINADGSIPADNPFFGSARGKYRAIWALGLRNPFAFAVQPGTGRIFINDVGNARLEEINEGVAGANYGWPLSEGPTDNPRHRGPLFAYDHNTGRSITGGTFYNPPLVQFPRQYVGKYFFLDFMDHWIRVLNPEDPREVSLFATGLAGPVAIVTAPDGSLYYLNRKEWVKDEKFQPHTGSVHRITYPANSGRPVPHIRREPDDLAVAPGHSAVLEVQAVGGAPLTYRWFRNGVVIPGAIGPRYNIPQATAADDGARFRCVVSNVFGSTKSRRASLRILSLREPTHATHLLAGLELRSYESRGDVLPDFAALTPVRTSSLPNVDVSNRTTETGMAALFRGFLDIETEGVYTFWLDSAGFSKLFIGAAEVACTAGSGHNREASGCVALKAGKHPLRLLFAQRSGRPRLHVSYAGPGLARQPIPDARLQHVDPAALAEPTIRPVGGNFSGPVAVRLETTTAKGTIHYTTDGSVPGMGSPVYRQPFVLDHSATVAARTFQGAASGSASVRATFTVNGTAPYGLPHRDLVTTLNVPQNPDDLPPLLSQTGVFRSLSDLSPHRGIIPYTVNAPLWSDGAAKRRWIALPGDARIRFTPTGEWQFPTGTVFIKHFELDTAASPSDKPRRLETRLLVVDATGNGYGATYKWRPDQQDADLVSPAGLTEAVSIRTPDGPHTLRWSYPSRGDCLSCHTTAAGFVLGVKTRQLNGPCSYPTTGITDNQLRTWNHLGMFTPAVPEAQIPRYARLAPVTDAGASLEHRVRSYLDANCAHCHRPGGARGLFDARFETPLTRQNLIDGPVAAADLGVRDAKLIAPGDVARSMLYERMSRRRDVFNMPPLASQVPDQAALRAVAEWIKSLEKDKGPKGRKGLKGPQ